MKIIGFIFILLLLSVFTLLPLFLPGYFSMHDDTQVGRVVEMGRALTEGQFPVRWVKNLGYGYGYPIFNFYGPLPYYFGGILYVLGIPGVVATKMMFGIAIIGATIAIFFALLRRFGMLPAMLAATMYTYAPYHAVQVYVRGSVGEYWVLVFWPLIFYALTEISLNNFSRKTIAIGAVGVFGAVTSHTLLGYITVLLMGTYIFVKRLYTYFTKQNTRDQLRIEITMLVLGLGLSAFFWLPALLEMQFTDVAGQIGQTAYYKDHFVCLSQLWTSIWGYGGSAKGCLDGMSFMLGKVHVILAVLGFVSIIRVKAKTVKSVLLSVLVLGLFSIFMMLPSSSFVWDAIPKFSFIQYPWRFLSVTGFSLAVLSAGFLYIFPQKKMQIVIFSVAILGIIGMNMKWFHPQSYTYLPADSYESINDISWRVSKISDEYLPTNFSKPKNQSEVPTRPLSSSIPVSVTPLFETAVRSRYVLEATQAAIVVINTAGFPGWVYYLNDDEVKATIKNGLPSLMLGPGQTIFEMRLKNTNVRIIANILTIISLIALGGLFYGKQTSKKR